MIAITPEPPYYAVIFTSIRTHNDHDAYRAMAQQMKQLAKQQQGFLGIESARESVGITVSYWSSLDAIKQWKLNLAHSKAQ